MALPWRVRSRTPRRRSGDPVSLSAGRPRLRAFTTVGVSEGTPKIAVVGGGAAGFFAAIAAAESRPDASVTLYESGGKPLRKVRVSGGGRCNVTHACFDPDEMARHYPRGSRELRGALHRWSPRDTVDWFAARGVPLKTEADGRMFPTTDDSATVIECLRNAAERAGVSVALKSPLADLSAREEGGFDIALKNGASARADAVCLAVGSLQGSPLRAPLNRLGHALTPLAPSLFAFDIEDERLSGLAGVSVPDSSVRVAPRGEARRGPLLVTHRGLSGPAVLRLSAWEARDLQERGYRFAARVNWLGHADEPGLRERFAGMRETDGRKAVKNTPFDPLPRRLWERLVETAGVSAETTWAQLPKKKAGALARELTRAEFEVSGKTTNKEEFVTCGGVALKEVDFRTMESKFAPALHFAGECLDIDGITGGFNFQAAWTTGRLAGLAMTATSRKA